MIAVLLLSFSAIFTALVMLPWIMPEVVRAITWKGILDPIYGLINPLLKDLGLIEQSIPFFGTPSLAMPSVILVNLWAGIPFFTLLLAGLKAIDKEQFEAAAIDGASGWRQFLHITLPGLQYVILVETLLSFIWTFNGFTQVFLLTGGGPLGSTKVYTIFAIEAAREFPDPYSRCRRLVHGASPSASDHHFGAQCLSHPNRTFLCNIHRSEQEYFWSDHMAFPHCVWADCVTVLGDQRYSGT